MTTAAMVLAGIEVALQSFNEMSTEEKRAAGPAFLRLIEDLNQAKDEYRVGIKTGDEEVPEGLAAILEDAKTAAAAAATSIKPEPYEEEEEEDDYDPFPDDYGPPASKPSIFDTLTIEED